MFFVPRLVPWTVGSGQRVVDQTEEGDAGGIGSQPPFAGGGNAKTMGVRAVDEADPQPVPRRRLEDADDMIRPPVVEAHRSVGGDFACLEQQQIHVEGARRSG